MSFVKRNIEKTIVEIAKAKKDLPEINHEGNPEHENSNDDIMNITLLNEFDPIKITPTSYYDSIAAIDSSSRYLRDVTVNNVLVGLSIYSSKKGFILGPYNVNTPYLGISSYRKILESISIDDPYIRVKNAVGYPFVADPDNEYKIDDIADELRTESENIGISVVDDHDLIILDGPIYPTPLELTGLFELQTEARVCHRIAYAKLVKDRIEKVKNKNVIGIVKRLENSKKLASDEAVVEAFRKKGLKIYGLKDPTILELIDQYFCRESERGSKSTFYMCAVGPFKIDYKLSVKDDLKCYNGEETVLENPPSKYAYYVILRVPYYSPSFFRVESFKKDMEKELSTAFSRVSERLIPTYIELVDNMSKRVSAGLFIYAYEVASNYLSIIHDDKLAFSSVAAQFLSGSR
ncbi:hypothetical protein DFR86_00425 [Acidianus sulfidivorans JP7]|uniref:NurA domain-containing protein n=1 Tax=Acidianus sulfidivorans JP7 TaxID=619593 RepID=A0A2U9IJE1_9CREN|nr:DNA double-strand break repair nuclease NurA [Acidianus sulfidivorans]AWR96159.1 hypothetical protein DFR86_00425 [Acidianus sulfidivorans JP7]